MINLLKLIINPLLTSQIRLYVFFGLLVGLYQLFLFILLLLNNNFSLAKKLDDIESYCINNTCSKVIKKINVGKFYFKARNCETKDYRKCQIWFGTPKNKLRAGWVKYYRLINGPMPLKLNCIMGQPIWYQDLPFPDKFTKNYEGIKTLKDLNFQNKEKIYFKRPANEPFKFFSFFQFLYQKYKYYFCIFLFYLFY